MEHLIQGDFFVVIPAFNEEKNIAEAVKDVKKYTDNIVVVDDGSQDKTAEKAKEFIGNGVILKHKINLGKGAALKTGCEAAIKLGAEIIVLMDGDGQHAADDIPKLLEKLKSNPVAGGLDIVFGERNEQKNIPLARDWGNKVITKSVNFLSGLHLKDILSGFKVFTKNAYEKIIWESQDYFVETEIAINVGKHKLKYSQIPIKTIYKDDYKGMDIANGIKIIFKILISKLQ